MVMVVRASDERVLYRGEAWELNSIEKALSWATSNGYEPYEDELTIMGNMIIWVK